MVFYNWQLVSLSGFSERTYYRRVKKLKEKNEFKRTSEGNLLTEAEALVIAEKLGFKKEFEQFLKQNTNEKKNSD